MKNTNKKNMENNKNKTSTSPLVIGTCLAAMLPCLAYAAGPSDAAVGEVDAVLRFCAKNTPEHGRNIESLRKLLTGKASAGARSSSQYKQGYDLVTAALEKGDKTKMRATCNAGLTEREREGREDHGHAGDHR